MEHEHDAVMLEAAARWLGAHALPAFALLLMLSLLGCSLLWRVLHRWLVPSKTSELPPGAFLFTRLALGFAVLVTGAWVFSELAEELGAGPVMARADQALADEIGRSVPRAALQFFALLTHLGDALTLTLLCVAVAAVLALRHRRGLALAWVFTVVGNALLNPLLKQVFARSRPVHDAAIATASGYSFPSGHSSGAVVAYGMLAYVLARSLPPRWHLPAALSCAALAFTVGCSRILLRVHFASDVLAGFASGAAWLAVCVSSVELTRHYRRRPA